MNGQVSYDDILETLYKIPSIIAMTKNLLTDLFAYNLYRYIYYLFFFVYGLNQRLQLLGNRLKRSVFYSDEIEKVQTRNEGFATCHLSNI